MKYLIIANGMAIDEDRLSELVKKADIVVCADGGARHLQQINIVPDILIGDMDSVEDNQIEYLTTNHIRTLNGNDSDQTKCKVTLIKYPEKKDYSDTELAVIWAIEHGATYITLTGVTGTRMDHTLSNIFLLRTITQRGIKCKIVDSNNEIFLLSHDTQIISDDLLRIKSKESPSKIELKEHSDNQSCGYFDNGSVGSISVNGKIGELLSIVPVTEEVRGVTLRGLEYPLNDATIAFGSSRGVSNVFSETVAYISIKSGMLLITKSSD